jgi:hypothetical protein
VAAAKQLALGSQYQLKQLPNLWQLPPAHPGPSLLSEQVDCTVSCVGRPSNSEACDLSRAADRCVRRRRSTVLRAMISSLHKQVPLRLKSDDSDLETNKPQKQSTYYVSGFMLCTAHPGTCGQLVCQRCNCCGVVRSPPWSTGVESSLKSRDCALHTCASQICQDTLV